MAVPVPATVVEVQLVSASGANRYAKCSCCESLMVWGETCHTVKRVKPNGKTGRALSYGKFCKSCEASGMIDLNFADELQAGLRILQPTQDAESRSERMAEHFARHAACGLTQEQAWDNWNYEG
tara:strand:+ start:64 stop:435 length:372 start_codon:yes stop_codon:yes gene_type:complete